MTLLELSNLKFKRISRFLIIALILFFIIFQSCGNLIPWKTKFFLGKWILPVQNTYFSIEFFKDGTFMTRGRKFCNIGNYMVMNHQRNSVLIKLNSVSNLFNTTLLILKYKEGLYIKWASYSQLWYSIKSDKGIKLIEQVTKNLQNIYEIETWDHYYLISFSALNKNKNDLLFELENPDEVQDKLNQQIFIYKNKGEDEFGNIYNYRFYLLNDVVIKVESEIAVKSIIN